MSGSVIGWVFIGCTALLLLLSKILSFGKDYPVRKDRGVEKLREAQIAAMERGEQRKILLGDRLSPLVYPGLGLHALSSLPAFLDKESGVDGRLTLAAADGGLVVFARQIVQSGYKDGFSPVLQQSGTRTELYGPTPFSFTAGFLPQLGSQAGGFLGLFGHYGPEALLWVEAVSKRKGAVFASGGTLPAQASLFLTVRDLLIGESTFLISKNLPGERGYAKQAFIEDFIRWVLILALLMGVLLKMGALI